MRTDRKSDQARGNCYEILPPGTVPPSEDGLCAQVVTTPPNKTGRLIILLIFVLGFACYAPSLTGPFLFDDFENISQNGHIRIRSLSPAAIAEAAFNSRCTSRPVANLSFALNYLLHGYWLPGYHLTNIVIHCLNGLLLFFLIKGTLSTPALRNHRLPPEQVVLIAGFSSLLWLANPLNTQAVSYIVQRMTSLAAMFFLFSLLLYLKFRTSPGRRRHLHLAGSLLSGMLALGSKEIAATLPGLIFLYEWYFFQDLDQAWLKKKLPLLGLMAAALVVLSWLYLRQDLSAILAGYSQRDFTVEQRLLTEPRVIWRYLALFFFPHPELLNLDYDFPLSTTLLNPPATLFAIATLAGLFLTALVSAPRFRLLSFGLLWFLLNLVIESTFLPLEIIFEHRAYLPSMFLWPPGLLLVAQLPNRPSQVARVTLVGLLVIFSVWTIQRNRLWADEEALNRDIVRKSPNKARAHANLGRTLIFATSAGTAEGLRELDLAIKLDPDYPFIYLYRGCYYLEQRNYTAAIASFQKVVGLKPDYDKIHYYLCKAYYENRQYPEAIAAARRAAAIPAFREEALMYLGSASLKTGEAETAVLCFRELSEYHPDNMDYATQLVLAQEAAGQPTTKYSSGTAASRPPL